MGFFGIPMPIFPQLDGLRPVLRQIFWTTYCFPFLIVAFPLADNMWWLSHLWLSVVCAHLYGGTLSTNRFAGWMAGATLILCDSLIREVIGDILLKRCGGHLCVHSWLWNVGDKPMKNGGFFKVVFYLGYRAGATCISCPLSD